MDPRRRRSVGFRPRFDALDDRCLLSGFTPSQITRAYGLDAITFAGGTVKGNGSGQTIALVEAYHDPYLAADLKAFDAAHGLADADISYVNLGNLAADDAWARESALDVEWAHAIAPGAKILVVEARSESITDLMAAVDVARRSPGVSAVSMSWGYSEFAGESAYDGYFTTPPGHQGVTFFTASGDSGPWSGAEWPSSSPNVVSVGGTSLRLSADGSIASEVAWAYSGGGTSLYEPAPWYQAAVGITGMRTTPDVAFLGDPNTGASVYFTTPSTGQATWATMGGTSLGAPAWAGIVAIVDQGFSLAGKPSLDGATQTLPALYALAAGHWGDFRDVASASSFGGGSFSPFAGSPAATLGANLATGLGTPSGPKLVADLVATPYATPASSIATGLTTLPTTTTTTTTTTTAGKKKKHHAPPKKKAKAVAHRRAVAHAAIDLALDALGS